MPAHALSVGRSSLLIAVGARLLYSLAVVAHAAARATEARVMSFTGFRIARDLEGSTTLGTLLKPLKPIHRRRELQPQRAEQSCWHQRDVESRKVAAKAKSGFDVLAQSRVRKSLNERQRSPGGIFVIQMQGPLHCQWQLRAPNFALTSDSVRTEPAATAFHASSASLKASISCFQNLRSSP